jgi:hypothetical protein
MKVYDTLQEAQAAVKEGGKPRAVYLLEAEQVLGVMDELRLTRLVEECGVSKMTAQKAVGILIGWLRQRAVHKWVVLYTEKL